MDPATPSITIAAKKKRYQRTKCKLLQYVRDLSLIAVLE